MVTGRVEILKKSILKNITLVWSCLLFTTAIDSHQKLHADYSHDQKR